MNSKKILLAALGTLFLAAALPAKAEGEYRAKAIAVFKSDFQPRGQASLDRLAEDGLQAICNRTGNKPPADMAKNMEEEMYAKIPFPADKDIMGNWHTGEQIAQSGRGFTWTDNPGLPVGGNCYNCHKISPLESSHGTVGPSLYQFGKIRGNTPEIRKYVFGKIWNAKSVNLCSEMPRFGHVGALTVDQVKHLVALLLAPESPVNSR